MKDFKAQIVNNTKVLNDLFDYLNDKYFNGSIHAIPSFENKMKKEYTVNIDKISNGFDNVYYDIKISERMLPDTEKICIALITDMILIDSSINDYSTRKVRAKTASNGGYYKNNKFRTVCQEKGFTVKKNGIYGCCIDDVPSDLKEELVQFVFQNPNIYEKNSKTRAVKTTPKKVFCEDTGAIARVTRMDLNLVDGDGLIKEIERHYKNNGKINITYEEFKMIMDKYSLKYV